MESRRSALWVPGSWGRGSRSQRRAGVTVKLHEPAEAPLARSRSSVEASLDRVVSRGRLSAEEAQALLGRIEWSADRHVLAGGELVVGDRRLSAVAYATRPRGVFAARGFGYGPIAPVRSPQTRRKESQQ